MCLVIDCALLQVKQRSRLLSQLFQSYLPYDDQMGKSERVLVTEVAHDGLHYVAHNKSYDQVSSWNYMYVDNT